MLTNRNPTTRASAVYRERYATEYRTAQRWGTNFGLVEKSELSPNRGFSPRRLDDHTPSPWRPKTEQTPSPRATPRASESLESTQSMTENAHLPTLSVRALQMSGSFDSSQRRLSAEPPKVPPSPVRTSRKNFTHLSLQERKEYYSGFVAKPHSNFCDEVTASFAMHLPKVPETPRSARTPQTHQ